MKTRTSNLKYVLSLGIVGAALLFGANTTANAQNHSQRAERHVLKDHQRQERRALKYEQRNERRVYNNSGGYYNNDGYNNSNGYYNDGRYNNRGGYYGSGRYSTPHRDSRNAFKRGIHHLFGGH